jgi:hypothetical protein
LCQHMPPSFGVNNLLLRNFHESVISLDSKSVEESYQILGAINTTTLSPLFSLILVAAKKSSFQVTIPKLQSFPWSMASSSSTGGSHSASAPPKASLSSIPLAFLLLLYLLKTSPLCLVWSPNIIHFFRILDLISSS